MNDNPRYVKERTVSEGVNRIAAERQRQVDDEGWTPEHDDTHTQGELAGMASWYAQPIAE
jgi:hypothetical protein